MLQSSAFIGRALRTQYLKPRQKYGAYCRTISYNILANAEDADECVNDTYLSAWNLCRPTVRRILRRTCKAFKVVFLNRLRDGNSLKRRQGDSGSAGRACGRRWILADVEKEITVRELNGDTEHA